MTLNSHAQNWPTDKNRRWFVGRCLCVGVWVCGCVGVWVCGCVGGSMDTEVGEWGMWLMGERVGGKVGRVGRLEGR